MDIYDAGVIEAKVDERLLEKLARLLRHWLAAVKKTFGNQRPAYQAQSERNTHHGAQMR